MAERGSRFRPDPSYRMDPDVRARVLPWYDADALEYFLSALPEESRRMMLDELFTMPGAQNKSIPQFDFGPDADPAMMDAMRAVFAPFVRMRPEDADLYPFDFRSRTPDQSD